MQSSIVGGEMVEPDNTLGSLYRSLGATVQGPGAAPADPEELEDKGRGWWSGNLEKIRAAICPHAMLPFFWSMNLSWSLYGPSITCC
jgi:hypothetical protein